MAETLARFMPHGQIDGEAFRQVVGSVVRQAAETGRPVRAYGEMVSLLWEAGDVLAAIELEKLWNDLGREYEFSLLCAYRSASVEGDEHAQARQHVCQLHSSVLQARDDQDPQDSADAEFSAQFSAEHDAPGSARHFVAIALGRWGHGGTLLDDAQLVVTELATNAVLHAQSPFSVTTRAAQSGVRISVRDRSPVTPMLRAHDPLAMSGRGLRLVNALAVNWGVEVTPDGKTVWAELAP